LTIFGKVLFMEVQMIGIVFEVYDDWDYLWSLCNIEEHLKIKTGKEKNLVKFIMHLEDICYYDIKLELSWQWSYGAKIDDWDYLWSIWLGLFLMYMMIEFVFNVYDDWDCS
jgi:hypothetical protein